LKLASSKITLMKDIIFFAGHSASDPDLKNGHLKINATDRLTIAELKYALKQSIEHGLKLVILFK
jgi:hypothetical protein